MHHKFCFGTRVAGLILRQCIFGGLHCLAAPEQGDDSNSLAGRASRTARADAQMREGDSNAPPCANGATLSQSYDRIHISSSSINSRCLGPGARARAEISSALSRESTSSSLSETARFPLNSSDITRTRTCKVRKEREPRSG
eukprot:scaffold13854_cov140-Isochrysis_galbana.AAC.2